MERIKHHFCWVKTVSGPRKTAAPVAGVGVADMSFAWSPETGSAQTSPVDDGQHRPVVTPPPEDVPTTKRKSKAAQSPKASRASVMPRPLQGGVPPAIGEFKAGASGVARGTVGAKNGGVPPASPAVTGSLKTLVPPPPPVTDPSLSIKNGPVPPANKRMIFAGATMAGAWAFEDLQLTGVPGGEGLRHDFQVVIGDEAAARAWLISPEGLDWLSDAKTVSLITFAVMGVY